MTDSDAIFIEFMRKLYEHAEFEGERELIGVWIRASIQGINAADQAWKDRMLKEFAAIIAPLRARAALTFDITDERLEELSQIQAAGVVFAPSQQSDIGRALDELQRRRKAMRELIDIVHTW